MPPVIHTALPNALPLLLLLLLLLLLVLLVLLLLPTLSVLLVVLMLLAASSSLALRRNRPIQRGIVETLFRHFACWDETESVAVVARF